MAGPPAQAQRYGAPLACKVAVGALASGLAEPARGCSAVRRLIGAVVRFDEEIATVVPAARTGRHKSAQKFIEGIIARKFCLAMRRGRGSGGDRLVAPIRKDALFLLLFRWRQNFVHFIIINESG